MPPSGARTALKHFIIKLWSNRDTRRVLVFLALNVSFMFVELFFGLLRGSLSLVSDAFHMFFDCTSLFMSMAAMFVSSRPTDDTFTFGYVRMEILAAFGNSLFLVFVSFMLVCKAIHRLLSPVDVSTDQLFVVSFIGLLVNLLGLFLFEAPAESTSVSRRANLRAIFLHVLADSLGSVGVIVSCLLIQHRHWLWADPVASLVIAALLLHAVVPLLTSAFHVLMLDVPKATHDDFMQIIEALPYTCDGVHEVTRASIWPLEPETFVIELKVRGDSVGLARDVKAALRHITDEKLMAVEVAR